jgi:hypothetical protein
MWISPVIEDKRNKEIAGIEAENKGIIVSLKCDYKDLRLPCGAVPELPEYLTAAHGTQDYPALSGKWRRSWEIYYAGSGIWKSRKLDQLKDIQELWRENSLILAALREEYGKLIDDKGMRLYDRSDPGEWRRRWGIVFSERKWHSTIIKDQFIIDALSSVGGLADAEGALADDIRALVLQDLSIVKDLNSRYKDVVLLAAVDVEWRQYRAESELWRSGLELVEFRGVWYSRKLERSRRPDAEPDEAALFLEDLDIKDMLQKKYGLVADLPTSLGGYKSSSLKWRKDWGVLRDNNGWVSVSLEDPIVRGRVADDLRIVRILKSRYEKLTGKFLVPFKGPVLAEKASSYLERSNNWRAHWGIVRRGDIIISTTIATRAKDNNVKLEPEDLQPKVKLLQELGYDLRSECEGLSLDENGNIAAESPVRNIPPVPVKPVGVVPAKEKAAAAKPGVPGRREVANISSRDNAIMEKLRKCPLFTVFEAEHSSEALFLFGRVRQLGDKLDAVFQLPGKVDSWREQQVVELVSETSGRGIYRLSAVLIKQLKEAGFSDGGEKQVSLQPSGLKEMLLSKLAYLLGTDRERLKNSKISEKFIIIFLSDDNSVNAEIARSETVLLSGGTLFASWWFVEGKYRKKGFVSAAIFPYLLLALRPGRIHFDSANSESERVIYILIESGLISPVREEYASAMGKTLIAEVSESNYLKARFILNERGADGGKNGRLPAGNMSDRERRGVTTTVSGVSKGRSFITVCKKTDPETTAAVRQLSIEPVERVLSGINDPGIIFSRAPPAVRTKTGIQFFGTFMPSGIGVEGNAYLKYDNIYRLFITSRRNPAQFLPNFHFLTFF